MGAFLLKLLRFSLSRVGNFSTSSFHGPLHPEQEDEKERHGKIIVKKLECISWKKILTGIQFAFPCFKLPLEQFNCCKGKIYQNESLQNLNARISNYVFIKCFFLILWKNIPPVELFEDRYTNFSTVKD